MGWKAMAELSGGFVGHVGPGRAKQGQLRAGEAVQHCWGGGKLSRGPFPPLQQFVLLCVE